MDAGFNWGSRLRVLDVSQPAVRDYLRSCLLWLANLGITYFKLDFLYAGAIPGPRRDPAAAVAGYRDGLTFIRECVGTESTILGCGAPLLPSVGRREDWAAHLRAVGGLASASDSVRDLDAWGLAVTRELMRPSDPAPAPPQDS